MPCACGGRRKTIAETSVQALLRQEEEERVQVEGQKTSAEKAVANANSVVRMR